MQLFYLHRAERVNAQSHNQSKERFYQKERSNRSSCSKTIAGLSDGLNDLNGLNPTRYAVIGVAPVKIRGVRIRAHYKELLACDGRKREQKSRKVIWDIGRGNGVRE